MTRPIYRYIYTCICIGTTSRKHPTTMTRGWRRKSVRTRPHSGWFCYCSPLPKVLMLMCRWYGGVRITRYIVAYSPKAKSSLLIYAVNVPPASTAAWLAGWLSAWWWSLQESGYATLRHYPNTCQWRRRRGGVLVTSSVCVNVCFKSRGIDCPK